MKYLLIILLTSAIIGCSDNHSPEHRYTVEIKYIDSDKIDTITTFLRQEPDIQVSGNRTKTYCLTSHAKTIACNVRTFQVLSKH